MFQTACNSHCSNDDDWPWISSLGSSSGHLGSHSGNHDMLTVQSFDSAVSNYDVYDTDDTTNDTSCSGLPVSPTISTGNLLTMSSAIPLDGKQLLFLYDCETTGGSHYDEHIIEIASVVIVPDDLNVSITKTEFTSLCHTSRRIHPMGK